MPPLSVLAVEALCLRGTVTKPLPGQLADFSSNKVVLAVIEAYRGCNSLRQGIVNVDMRMFISAKKKFFDVSGRLIRG